MFGGMLAMNLIRLRSFQVALLAVVISMIFTLVVAPGFSRLSAGSAAADSTLESRYEFVEVTVSRGDTVWTLARTYGPDSMDTRKVVHIIEQENQLQSYVVHPGDILLIPSAEVDPQGR